MHPGPATPVAGTRPEFCMRGAGERRGLHKGALFPANGWRWPRAGRHGRLSAPGGLLPWGKGLGRAPPPPPPGWQCCWLRGGDICMEGVHGDTVRMHEEDAEKGCIEGMYACMKGMYGWDVCMYGGDVFMRGGDVSLHAGDASRRCVHAGRGCIHIASRFGDKQELPAGL